MNKINYHYSFRVFFGLMLSLSLFGFSYAQQTLPKHYPQYFDLDGYVTEVNITRQVINLNGFPYNMNLETIAYDLKGGKMSLLSLNSKMKVGVKLSPFVKGQPQIVRTIWVLPPNYNLEYRPM